MIRLVEKIFNEMIETEKQLNAYFNDWKGLEYHHYISLLKLN